MIILLLLATHLCAEPMTKTQFIDFIAKHAQATNEDIIKHRKEVLAGFHQHLKNQPLSAEQHWVLLNIAKAYKIHHPDFSSALTWQKLIMRVDIVPVSLVIAQAINESAWGRSRFAREGHNYFGQWCYSKGCGIVPLRRTPGANYEVRKFKNVGESVSSYMLNLNTTHLYYEFRTHRHTLRLSNQPITGLALVEGLIMYSTRRQAYVDSIRGIIKTYQLEHFD